MIVHSSSLIPILPLLLAVTQWRSAMPVHEMANRRPEGLTD